MRDKELSSIWVAVLAVLFVTAAALWAADVRILPGPKGFVMAWVTAGWLYLSFRFHPRQEWLRNILDLGNGLLLMSAIALCGAFLSYLIVRVSPFPFADPLLYRVDLALGFDWLAVYEAYRQNDTLIFVTQRIYLSIFTLPTMVILGLSLTGQEKRLRAFLLTFAAAMAMTLATFMFFPAITPIFYLGGNSPPYVPVGTGYPFLSLTHELRSGVPIRTDIQNLYGLISFPSFHAVSAVVYGWFAWSVRVYRWPLILVSAAMFLATPMEGAHYLVEMIAGTLIAAAAIVLVDFLERKSFAARPSRFTPAFARRPLTPSHAAD